MSLQRKINRPAVFRQAIARDIASGATVVVVRPQPKRKP